MSLLPCNKPIVASALLLAFLLFHALSALATPVEALYEVEVRVQGQGPEQQQAGFREALGKLLVKLTGDPARARDQALLGAFGKPEGYVQQYGYTRDPSPYPGRGPLRLRVAFDETQVAAVLRSQGVPVWGANRPGVLVWLGVREGQAERLYSPELDAELRSLAERAAFARGIPLIFPLMDLEDQARVAPEVFWGGGELAETIRQASGRYAPDVILVGRLTKAGAGWSAEWLLLSGGEREGWKSGAGDPEAVFADGVGKTANRLGQAYAPRPGAGAAGGDIVLLRVEGIGSVEDYAALRRYLSGINGAASMLLRRAGPDFVEYDVDVLGSATTFQRELSLGGVLADAGSDVGFGTSLQRRLRYRMR